MITCGGWVSKSDFGLGWFLWTFFLSRLAFSLFSLQLLSCSSYTALASLAIY